MSGIKHQQKLVYELCQKLKQEITIKDKNSWRIERNPFPNKNNTLSNVNIARNSTIVPRPLSNDPRFTQCIYRYSRASKRFVEVYIETTQCYLIYMNPGANFINEFTTCFCLKNIVRSSYVKNRVSSNYWTLRTSYFLSYI